MSSHTQQGNRRRKPASRAGDSASSWTESSMDLVEEYPISSTLLAFGVGLGVGVLVAQTLAGALSSHSEPQGRLDSLSQQVCDAVRNAVPDAIGRYLPR